ncbi:hypothetical protein ACNR9Q_03145 [Maribacter sp. X9]|uniref:hypothetical protein n=1 Tax=Maribacter sp. X9 TaxID=3402159 RepID=UPI003AF3A570
MFLNKSIVDLPYRLKVAFSLIISPCGVFAPLPEPLQLGDVILYGQGTNIQAGQLFSTETALGMVLDPKNWTLIS